jgi:hypothetical protein
MANSGVAQFEMRQIFRGLIGLFVFPAIAWSAEPWGDDRLPVKEGLELWYDCSRQNAGRTLLPLPPLGSGNTADYLLDSSGRGRNLVQHRSEARPRFLQAFGGAFLSFDGKDDATPPGEFAQCDCFCRRGPTNQRRSIPRVLRLEPGRKERLHERLEF